MQSTIYRITYISSEYYHNIILDFKGKMKLAIH